MLLMKMCYKRNRKGEYKMAGCFWKQVVVFSPNSVSVNLPWLHLCHLSFCSIAEYNS